MATNKNKISKNHKTYEVLKKHVNQTLFKEKIDSANKLLEKTTLLKGKSVSVK